MPKPKSRSWVRARYVVFTTHNIEPRLASWDSDEKAFYTWDRDYTGVYNWCKLHYVTHWLRVDIKTDLAYTEMG